MSEGKAVMLVMALTVLLGSGAWLGVVLLGGNGGLATVAMFVVAGIGCDQMSRITMSYHSR